MSLWILTTMQLVNAETLDCTPIGLLNSCPGTEPGSSTLQAKGVMSLVPIQVPAAMLFEPMLVPWAVNRPTWDRKPLGAPKDWSMRE